MHCTVTVLMCNKKVETGENAMSEILEHEQQHQGERATTVGGERYEL